MAKCASCGARKGKRECPALGAGICAACCGQKRGVQIDCPDECGFYVPRGPDRSVEVFDRVIEKLVEFSKSRPSMMREAVVAFGGADVQSWEHVIAIAYTIYGHRDARGRCLADIYHEQRAALLSRDQLAVLEALREARFSLFEVRKVHLETGLDIVDLVDGDAMFVHEKEGTRTAAAHDLLLTWVVSVGGRHVTSGAAARIMRGNRALVLDTMRDALERHRADHPDAPEHVARGAAVVPVHRALRERHADGPAPELRNTDGETLASLAGPDGDDLDPGQLAELDREIGVHFVRHWLDLEIPALDGMTPRQAARVPRMREALVDLVDGYENTLAHQLDEPMDLGWVYEELGIERQVAPTPGPEPTPAPDRPDGLEAAREAIERLMQAPIQDLEKLTHVLTRAGTDASRTVLVDLVERGSGIQEDFAAICLPLIGPGLERDRLLALVRDRSICVHRRITAVMALGPGDPDLEQYMDEEDYDLIDGRIFDRLFQTILTDPDGLSAISQLLMDQDAPKRPEVLERIERARRVLVLPPSVLYGQCLQEPGLADLHDRLLELVSPERTASAAAPARRDATALVSSCDGTGAYQLLLHVERRDGRHSVASLCVRAGGDVRNGFSMTGVTRERVDELVERTASSSGSRLVPMEPEVASTLVRDAVDVTSSMPADCAAAVGFFGLFDAGTSPAPTPAASVTAEELSSLLEREAYMDAWFFDGGDLADIEPPPTPASRSWIERAARTMASTPARESVVAMARHMAMWHSLADEPASASMMAAAARMTEDDFATSPLVHVMLANHHPGHGQDIDPRWLLGDPVQRRSLRARFLSSVKRPRGRAMAELDMSVASFVLLLQHFASRPSYARPPEQDVEELAHEVGRRVAAYLTKNRGQDEGRIHEVIERALGRTHRDAAPHLFEGLLTYYYTYCLRCPVDCFGSPRRGTAEAFNSDVHPLEP
ncbi:MAG: hypothetical protein JRG91_03950 [Deltaproteobacteria bacterium]|nr:hypothetical protein [Deltaproteobacteria bacterium]